MLQEIHAGVTFYNISDGAPLSGNDYYRISEIDRDGKILYSEVKMVSFDFAPATVIISPNPAKDHLNISIAGNKQTLHLVSCKFCRANSFNGDYER